MLSGRHRSSNRRGIRTPLLSSISPICIALSRRGTRPGGNNQPLYNDDGPCVAEAANLLLDQPGREHVLIVISDGIPEGRLSQPDDLHTAGREAGRVQGLRFVARMA